MTKSLRNILISILGAVFILCACLCILSPVIARADDVVLEAPISDDNFSFVSGASVPLGLFAENPESADFDLATARTLLMFQIKLSNLDYENLARSVPHPTNWIGRRSDNVFIYEFTLHRSNRDGDPSGDFKTLNPQHSILIVIYPDADKNFYGYVAEKNYYTNSYLSPNISWNGTTMSGSFLSGSELNSSGYRWYDDIAEDGDEYHWQNTWQKFGKNYVIKERFKLNYNNLKFYANDGLCLDLVANVDSPFQYYYITMRYCYDITYDAGDHTRAIEYGEICSSTRSVANVIQRMDALGVDLDATFGATAEYAYEILYTTLTEHVRIKYLSEIEGTPYATHNYTYIDVPILQDTIRIADVEAALGFSIGKCHDSNTVSFRKTSDNDGVLYEAYYLKNTWLRAATPDGNYLDYFLDLNLSYKDFYYPYVAAGALTEDAFEWIYSQKLLNKFPALDGYLASEIYGYFGMIITPKSYSINSSLKEMFDIKTSKIGVISNFSYEGVLSGDAYDSLMSDYGYNWLSRTWGKVGGILSGDEKDATFYVIYSEPGTESALIGEGGQTDAEHPGSVVGEKIVGPVMGILGDAWDGITGFFGGIAGNFKTILWIALGAIILIIGIKIYINLKGKRRK